MNGRGSTHSFSVHGLTIKLSKNQLKAVAFIVHNFQVGFIFLTYVKLLKGAFSKVELQKMGTQLKEGNAKWFNHEFGLCKKGKKIDDKVASLTECRALWGIWNSRNGFKYESCNNLVLIARIQELYIIVYQKEKITNNIIAFRFTKGVLVKKKGMW